MHRSEMFLGNPASFWSTGLNCVTFCLIFTATESAMFHYSHGFFVLLTLDAKCALEFNSWKLSDGRTQTEAHLAEYQICCQILEVRLVQLPG